VQWDPEGQSIADRLRVSLSLLLDGAAIVVGPVRATDGAPSSPKGVRLQLLTLAPEARAPNARNNVERDAEFRVQLRYIATAWAEDDNAANDLLCKLAFRLLDAGAQHSPATLEVEVEPGPPPHGLWPALGIPARPALILALPLIWSKKRAAAPRVMSPVVVRAGVASGLRGSVVGPNGSPVAGARVEWPAFALFTETDADGHFAFARVPAEYGGQEVRVCARGVEQTVRLPKTSPGDPLILQLTFNQEE
jgi:Carboxypeptidase regulatory-like domain